jgi:hypothetical protein
MGKTYEKKDNNKNATGRPEKFIDKTLFENLCKIQCTKEEICEILDADEKTVTKFCALEYGESFKDVWKVKSSPGRASLRRMQFKKAEQGNTTMLIWLGKQYLGQADKVENEISGKDGGAIEITSPSAEIRRRIDGIAKRIGESENTE